LAANSHKSNAVLVEAERANLPDGGGKMHIRLRLIRVVGIAFVLLCALALLLLNGVSYDDLALKETAQRIGVTPTHSNILQYVNESIHNGMSREEVETLLSRIAPIEIPHRGNLVTDGGIEPYACDVLTLKASPFYGNFRFRACYYGEGKSLFQWVYQD